MSQSRTKGIGGTDISAIVGLNPWKSAIDVYMEKLGLVEPQPDNENMWWGREMEPVLRKRYEKETGNKTYPFNREIHILPIHYTFNPWYKGIPDDLVYQDGGVDYKTADYSKIDDWGEAGTDHVPAYYHCQAMWYMGLTGAQWWDIAVLFMGARREFKVYRITRDDELINYLIARGKDFWDNHIIPQVPPPVDAAKGWDTYFSKRWPREEEDFIESSDYIENILCGFIGHKKNMKIAEDQHRKYENIIKDFIGEHAGIKGDFGKITWKKSKDRTVTDWQKAYFDLCEHCYNKGLIVNDDDFSGKHTTIKPGHRVIKPYWKKED